MSAITAASPDVLRGMVAVSKDSKVKPLGYVTWFSVPDEDVPVTRLKRSWGMAGLDPQPLPKDPRAVDAFKRAVRDEEKVGTFTDEATGLKVETDVRKIVENDQDVIYQVTRVERDISQPQHERVIYQGALRVWWSKVTESVGMKPMEGQKAADVYPIMESIRDRIDANAKSVTGAKVREMVRSYVINEHDEGWFDERTKKTYGAQIGLSGEELGGKRKGIYFVLAKHQLTLDSLAEFLHSLYKPSGRAYLYYLPMADGASERELIRRHHSANCLEAIKEEETKVRDLLRPVQPGVEGARERGPRENVIKHHYHELERLRRRAGEYQSALSEEQAVLTDALEVLNKQLRKLLTL